MLTSPLLTGQCSRSGMLSLSLAAFSTLSGSSNSSPSTPMLPTLLAQPPRDHQQAPFRGEGLHKSPDGDTTYHLSAATVDLASFGQLASLEVWAVSPFQLVPSPQLTSLSLACANFDQLGALSVSATATTLTKLGCRFNALEHVKLCYANPESKF